MSDLHKLINKIFCDKQGKVVLYQTPNWPLIGFMFWLIVALFSKNYVQIIASAIATVFLLWWSLLELFLGVTIFRKLLGLFMLIVLIIGLALLVV